MREADDCLMRKSSSRKHSHLGSNQEICIPPTDKWICSPDVKQRSPNLHLYFPCALKVPNATACKRIQTHSMKFLNLGKILNGPGLKPSDDIGKICLPEAAVFLHLLPEFPFLVLPSLGSLFEHCSWKRIY